MRVVASSRQGGVLLEKRIAAIATTAIILISLMAGVQADSDRIELELDFANLSSLEAGHYEGWLIVGGSPVSTGKFVVSSTGEITDLDGNTIERFRVDDVDLEAATTFVLTIEPEGDTDSTPAAVKPLAGDLNAAKDAATLAPNLGVDLTGISGKYILATPTNNFPSDDYELDLEFAGLPTLASGHYEGWLIVGGSPVSTGKFNIDANGDIVDLSGSPIDSFLLEDLDVANVEKFVLSIEDEGDDDAIPGAVKPLAGDVDGTGLAGTIAHAVGVDLSNAGGVYILATPSNNVDFNLDLDFNNLPTLASGHYEGWLIVDGSPVSTGKFNIDANGDIVDLSGSPIDSFLLEDLDVANVAKFVLTVEPEGDTDAVPATPKPLAGDVDVTGLAGDIGLNLGVALDSVSGEYILATPSNNDDYNLDLTFDNLAQLSTGHYEGWLIVDGSPVSTGKFNIDANGDIVDLSGSPIDSFLVMDLDIANLEKFVLTIEEEGDTDTVPGAIKPLAGDVDGTGMAGVITHNIGVDLTGIAGEYILATPTDGASTNELSGVWFLNRSGASPVAGLNLPDLTGTDWSYEGWVVIDGVPVTTGKFDKPDGADAFDGYSGAEAAPPFPGEDFLTNAPTGLTFPTDISGDPVVISIEPRVGDDPGPFQFKPLVGTTPAPATDHIEYPLTDMTSTLATGTFALSDAPTDELSGIWYLNRSTGTPVAGLDLPDLTGTDWVYEGWVVIDGVPVTSGTFVMAEGADAFDDYSASTNYPPFPGEDFLVNAPTGVTFPTDLSGAKAVISIEPSVDDDPAPFILKPLVGDIPEDATDHIEYGMMDKTAMLPSGTFMLSAAPTEELSGIWYLDRSGASPVAGLDLPDLTGTDWVYEGWVVIDGVPVTSGTFVTPEGVDAFDGYSASTNYPPFPGEDFLVNAPTGVTFPTDLSGAKAVISIEPSVDDDPAPFLLKPLVGDIPEDATDHLEYSLGAAPLPTGSFALTQIPVPPSNELSGIWFLDPSSGTPAAGLDLPDLTGTDWVYEGWVVIDGVPVTTGTFDSADGADAFDGYSGTEGAPPFPGEDFLVNAPSGLTFPTDITGGKAVISIEPRNDEDPAPFQFKPLVGDIPVDAMDHTVYDMTDQTSGLPSGTVTIMTVSEDDEDDDNMLLYVGIGIVIILVIVGVTVFARKGSSE
jgi:hypothetical protein